MKEIRGDAQNLRKLLGGSKYAIDYYQREYRWQAMQVQVNRPGISGNSGHSRFDETLQRTVKENCNTLRFGNADFEDGSD